MLHENSQRLIDEWQRQTPHGARLPQRTAMSPMGFGPLLSQLFILGCDRSGRARFRLAGGMVSDLHGRDLRDAEFGPLWQRDQRHRLQVRLDEARATARPLALHATSESLHGTRLDLEITLAPLEGPGGEADRFIGLYQLRAPTPFLTGRPVAQLSLVSTRWIETQARHGASGSEPHLRLVVNNGRRVA